MSRMIKTSLVALSILASASVGYAADKDGRGGDVRGGWEHDGRSENTPDIWERDQVIDPNATGSIQGCDSGSYDEFGNCIVDPNMQ